MPERSILQYQGKLGATFETKPENTGRLLWKAPGPGVGIVASRIFPVAFTGMGSRRSGAGERANLQTKGYRAGQ